MPVAGGRWYSFAFIDTTLHDVFYRSPTLIIYNGIYIRLIVPLALKPVQFSSSNMIHVPLGLSLALCRARTVNGRQGLDLW